LNDVLSAYKFEELCVLSKYTSPVIDMCSVPPLGAFIKNTTKYVYPAVANKSEKYVCPDCNKDLILRKGQIRINHFAHYKSDSPCN
jgi:predicted RNA-binding Zn-ribbon protein involved in translation (DUF1610 family)